MDIKATPIRLEQKALLKNIVKKSFIRSLIIYIFLQFISPIFILIGKYFWHQIAIKFYSVPIQYLDIDYSYKLNALINFSVGSVITTIIFLTLAFFVYYYLRNYSKFKKQ